MGNSPPGVIQLNQLRFYTCACMLRYATAFECTMVTQRETVRADSNVPALTQIYTLLFHSEHLTTYSGTFKLILKLSLNSDNTMYEHLRYFWLLTYSHSFSTAGSSTCLIWTL